MRRLPYFVLCPERFGGHDGTGAEITTCANVCLSSWRSPSHCEESLLFMLKVVALLEGCASNKDWSSVARVFIVAQSQTWSGTAKRCPHLAGYIVSES
jgi:hypothetical protein